ncbi:unnamed protein product [Clonostachys byssicola]|uniref:Fungal-specific transcription factor domain-containing protein n=1 Tax=Clonostachys byssicola TaxID=160290 RepID=A0A9N9Y6P4_9HYPO|nr:unnamed protein product [Clonostachys byssicola]
MSRPVVFPGGLDSPSQEKAILYFYRRLWPLLTASLDPIPPPLQAFGDHKVVLLATGLLADSHRFLQDKRNRPPDTVEKRRQCIEAVNEELGRCSADGTISMQPLLFAILLLYFYEGYIDCSRWPLSTLIHHGGIQATLEKMGGLERVLNLGHESLQVLVSLFATADLTSNMLRGGVPSFSPLSWRLFHPSSVWWQQHVSTDESSPTLSLTDVFEQMSAMLLYRQSLGSTGARPSTDRIRVFEQALQPAYAPFKSLSTSSLASTDSSSTSHYAFIRAYQHTALIYLYREVCGLSTSHPLVQQHVDACLDTINMLYNSSKAINCLVFPLCVAGSHSLAVPRQRQILKMLLAVQNEMRFTSLQHLIEFLEACWRVKPEENSWLETFTMLNKNIISF